LIRQAEGEAAMTASFFRVTAIALTAVGLAGCIDARSQYAPYEGYVSPPPNLPMRRPQYPVTGAPAPAQAAAPAADPDGPGPRAAPTKGVEAQGLPPVGDAAPRRDSMRYDSGRSPLLIPLVWRSDSDQASLIDVARHRRLRPEIDATSSERKHGRRGHVAEAPPIQTVTIKKGDTINSIARSFHTTPKAIMEANQGSHPKKLKIGDELQVPTPDAPPTAAGGRHPRDTEATADSGRHGRSSDTDTGRGRRAKAHKAAGYVVKHGDTLYSIARRNGVTVDELKDLNRLRSASHLHTGQKLKLPGDVVEEAPPEERPARAVRTPRPVPSRRSPPPPSESAVSGSAFQAPPAPSPTPAPPSTPAPLPPPPETAIGPSHPVPYSSLPGALPQQTPQARPPRPSATYPASPPPSYSSPYTPPASPSGPLAEAPAGPTDAQVASAGKGRFIWPTRGSLLIGFGPMAGGQRNDGLDIAAPDGSPVHAAAAGDVVYAGNLVPGFGNLVLIKHEDGWVTAYAHLSNTEVKIRDHVAQGAEIGTVGTSGGVSQPQLHFEVRYAPSPRERARPIDPALVLPVGQ
jgi:murein DD-endopeptidase MepM/ murein hydrolase activator NlpD